MIEAFTAFFILSADKFGQASNLQSSESDKRLPQFSLAYANNSTLVLVVVIHLMNLSSSASSSTFSRLNETLRHRMRRKQRENLRQHFQSLHSLDSFVEMIRQLDLLDPPNATLMKVSFSQQVMRDLTPTKTVSQPTREISACQSTSWSDKRS